MQTITGRAESKEPLKNRFDSEIRRKVPHREETPSGAVVVNPTPLVDITDSVLDCARSEFGLEFSWKNAKIFGKFDSEILGGSVKVRPATRIIDEAIASGKLERGKMVFEATSGNFGIALGMLRSLGFDVVALVSRKLQGGVLAQLEKAGVRLVNLDVDVCPAPGLQMDTNLLIAKTVANSVREQLERLGLDLAIFDASRAEIEQLLARQDVINLAKLLARIYDGFCPEQYDNELNVEVHETVTGPEIDQQLKEEGYSLEDFEVLCTFGTGGTSTGIARYQRSKYDRKGVHVVFPLMNQEVGGIRTKEKAVGLKFYRPELYAGEHEVDFEPARRVLRFFASRGFDIGESSALALYACIQMLNFDAGTKFVVMIADGLEKYRQGLSTSVEVQRRYQVTLQEARSNLADYAGVLWTHSMFAPNDEGIKVIASSLGCDQGLVKVAQTKDVDQVIVNKEVPETLRRILPENGGKILLVCMVGGTSFTMAKLLAGKGIVAESLVGGIMGVPGGKGRNPSDLVQLARESDK